ncbi:hypothetical protein LSPH26S_05010 [Lysinibacillus sphaericus]
MAFHLLIPGSTAVVGERLIDTVIGSILALGCSYILPSWEATTWMSAPAPCAPPTWITCKAAWITCGSRAASRPRTGHGRARGADPLEPDAQERPSGIQQLRRRVLPNNGRKARAARRHVEFNRLLIQNHTLASQMAAVIPSLARMDREPKGIAQAIRATQDLLQDKEASPPNVIETEGELATIAYPLRQMTQAAQVIRDNMRMLDAQALAPALAMA